MEETLEQKVARLERENFDLKQENTDALTTVGELSEKLANAEAVAPEQVVVTHDKKQYRVLAHKFNHNGAEIAASNLQANKEVLADLVKMKSGVLQLITKAEKAEASQ
jgi:hypothetical protein